MTGILMGAEINDHHGKSLILVVLDVSVYDTGMSGSLILAECLMEARYSLNLSGALTDEFVTATFPLYWSSITAQGNLIVMVMEYAGHT